MQESQSNKKKYKEVSKGKKQQKQPPKVHRGVFIADQRRKGRNGRIKSLSIPNKIEVRLKNNKAYLHQTEVQWVEVTRYSKKQGKKQKKQGPKKYKQAKKQQKEQPKQDAKTPKQKDQSLTEPEPKEEHVNKEQQNGKDNQNDREGDMSSQSSQDKKQKDEIENGDERAEDMVEEKREQDDIVIVAEITKQIANPFWKKPFVGVLRFQPKDSAPSKYKQKVERSNVSKILDDFNIDLHPIHMRLPVCYTNITNNCQKVLEDYVSKSVKVYKQEKGGKIRNKFLNQLESTYALVKFTQMYKGHPYVQLVKIIGKARTIDGQCNCFLYEHELNDFEHEPEDETGKIELNISPIHKEYNEMVFTIDPITSTDLDDALSVRRIGQNQYEFGIHISDVSSYMQNIKRQEIVKRTTSVYLPHQVFHMLPANLVEICSLNPKVKRLAFSVFVRMNDNGDIVGSKIEKNVIMSRFKLGYEQAQSILVNQMDYDQFNKLHQCTQEEYKMLVEKLKIMEKVGMAHRKKRLIFEIFDNDQIKFEFDEDKWPINFTVTSRFTAQKLIEEFMIIGNIESAKKIVEMDPKNSLIIHHPKPSDLAIRQFNQYFKILNMKFKFESSLQLQADLLKVSEMKQISEDIKNLCYFKARRAQQTAAYKRYSQVADVIGNVHFALGLRYYTHFTSPMRRIADILVHEVLNSAVDPKAHKKQLLDKQIQQSNWGRKNTKRLKKDLTQIYLCLMIFKTNKKVEAEAIVASLGCKSISIYIPLLDMSKEVMWKDMDVDKVYKNKKDQHKFDVIIYYDKRDSRKDVIWVAEKFLKFPVKINCSDEIPLKLTFQFKVQCNKGKQIIGPYRK